MAHALSIVVFFFGFLAILAAEQGGYLQTALCEHLRWIVLSVVGFYFGDRVLQQYFHLKGLKK